MTRQAPLTRKDRASVWLKTWVKWGSQFHRKKYWNARDNYRFGVKKKKRKRERSVEANGSASSNNSNSLNNSMKKCRARYGLDLHNQWCKPCRYTFIWICSFSGWGQFLQSFCRSTSEFVISQVAKPRVIWHIYKQVANVQIARP